MIFAFNKVDDKFPKKAKRSERTLKKLHLGTYAMTCVSVDIEFKEILVSEDNESTFDLLVDAIDSVAGAFETCSFRNRGFNMMFCVPSATFEVSEMANTIKEIMRVFSDIEPAFAEVPKVDISYGDAWYGDW